MTPHDQAPEHEFEAAYGLPQALPRDEHLLWQGSPDWRLLARQVMHVRALSVYFAVLLGLRGLNAYSSSGSWIDVVKSILWMAPLAVLAIGLLTLLAWLIARTSVYSITNKRVVMRIGVVLSVTFNLPFSRIEAAALQTRADGSGDLSLLLDDSSRIAYLHLWPHARPWRLRRPEASLRSLQDARSVADILARALAASTTQPRTTLRAATVAGQQPTGGSRQQPLAA